MSRCRGAVRVSLGRLQQPVEKGDEGRVGALLVEADKVVRLRRQIAGVRQPDQAAGPQVVARDEFRQQRDAHAADRGLQAHGQQAIARTVSRPGHLGADLCEIRRPRVQRGMLMEQGQLPQRLRQRATAWPPLRRAHREQLQRHDFDAEMAGRRPAAVHDGGVQTAVGQVDGPDLGRDVQLDLRMLLGKLQHARQQPDVAQRDRH